MGGITLRERWRRERNAKRVAHIKKVNLRNKFVRRQKAEVKQLGQRIQQREDWIARDRANTARKHEPYKKGMVTMKRAGLLLERLEKTHKFNVVKEIIEIYQKAEGIQDLDKRLRLQTRIATGLLDYCFPRLKAMELKTTDEKPVVINIEVPKQSDSVDQIKAQREAMAIEQKRRAALTMGDEWEEELDEE